jgi:hypothetical protein
VYSHTVCGIKTLLKAFRLLMDKICLKPLIQIALKLFRIKLKTKSVIIQAPMESVRQSVMYYNSSKLKVGKQRCINHWKINHVEV